MARFIEQLGELPEGIATDRFGPWRVRMSPLGGGPTRHTNGPSPPIARFSLNFGDFGVMGLNIDRRNTPDAAVVSTTPKVHGVWQLTGQGGATRLAGSRQIAFPNAVTLIPRAACLFRILAEEPLGRCLERV